MEYFPLCCWGGKFPKALTHTSWVIIPKYFSAVFCLHIQCHSLWFSIFWIWCANILYMVSYPLIVHSRVWPMSNEATFLLNLLHGPQNKTQHHWLQNRVSDEITSLEHDITLCWFNLAHHWSSWKPTPRGRLGARWGTAVATAPQETEDGVLDTPIRLYLKRNKRTEKDEISQLPCYGVCRGYVYVCGGMHVRPRVWWYTLNIYMEVRGQP